MKPFQFKRPYRSELEDFSWFDPNQCAAAKCRETPEVTLGPDVSKTGLDAPLCERHWLQWCERDPN